MSAGRTWALAVAFAGGAGLAACGGASAPDAAHPADDLAAPVPDLGGAPAGATFTFTLDAGAYPPGPWPSVLVYAPAGFRTEKPVHAVIWLHGLGNCVENVVRDQDGECVPDGGLSSGFGLIRQLEASGRNALLIVPELAFDSASHDPGNLATPGGTRALLEETLADLRPYLGELSVADLAPLVLAAHSAGHAAAAAILGEGSLPVAEVWHLDSLYDEIPVFVDWVLADLDSFRGSPPERRFADIYTALGGTADNSVAFADTAEADWLPDAGAILDDRSETGLSDEALRRGLVFKLSPLSHNDVAHIWFVRLLATARLPAR